MTKEQVIQLIEVAICELRDYSDIAGTPFDRTTAEEAIVRLEEVIDALEHRRHPAQLSRQDCG